MASSQSIHPWLWICQVLLSIVPWAQRVPLGDTTSMDPVLRSPSVAAEDRAVGGDDACTNSAATAASPHTPIMMPPAHRAREMSPAAAAEVFSLSVPVARIMHHFVAGRTGEVRWSTRSAILTRLC